MVGKNIAQHDDAVVRLVTLLTRYSVRAIRASVSRWTRRITMDFKLTEEQAKKLKELQAKAQADRKGKKKKSEDK